MIAHLKGNPDWSVTAVAKQGRAIRRTFQKRIGHGLSGGNPLLVGPMCGELPLRSRGSAEKRGRLAVTLNARWHDLRGHLPQGTLWHNKIRFVAVPAGRRSGKTEIAKRRLVMCLSVEKPWPDPRYFFAGPTYRQARRVAWDDLIALTPAEWIERIRQTDLCIRTVWGSELWVLGLDQPARVEGVGWDGGVLDESCDLRQGVFGRSIRPAISDRGGWLWQIGVPKRAGAGTAEYREFCWRCARGEYPDGAHFAWPSRDILPAVEIEHARETLDPRDFREQYEACWEMAGGQIFHAFSREYNVRPCPYERNLPLVVGSDFNVDPLCWVIGHRYPNRLKWFDEIWLRNANTQAGLDTLYHRYQHHKGGFEFYGDASGKGRTTSAAATDYVQIANDARFQRLRRTIHYPSANPAIADRFASTNAMFVTAAGVRRMFIDPACRRLIQDLEVRSYRPGTREPADTADVGHISDAMGYAVSKLFPIRLENAGPGAVIIQRG